MEWVGTSRKPGVYKGEDGEMGILYHTKLQQSTGMPTSNGIGIQTYEKIRWKTSRSIHSNDSTNLNPQIIEKQITSHQTDPPTTRNQPINREKKKDGEFKHLPLC